jgi:leucyl/phenylalanyl-tRNA--protein transferase
MSIYWLPDEIWFPPVEEADEDGVLAAGGDLSPERLLAAYSRGIFPWYSELNPILWWSPDPRFVLFPEQAYVSKTMRQILKRGIFEVTFDRDFESVIENCRGPRKREQGTWINDEMKQAYIELHRMGYAHSVEAWRGGRLAGGLYGISLGRCFFGESMFTKESNASKAAFLTLASRLEQLGFDIIDCQVYTDHLDSLGAEMISRHDFIRIIKASQTEESITGSWSWMEKGGVQITGSGGADEKN